MNSPSLSPAVADAAAPSGELLAKAFSELKGNPFLSDVTLRVIPNADRPGDHRDVPAHKVVLAAMSPTFHTMFKSGMQEAAAGSVVEVNYSLPTFQCLLHFVYTGEATRLASCDALEVLDAAEFYQLTALKDAAVVTLRHGTTNENVLEMLQHAQTYQCDRLRDHCLGFIRQSNTEVLHSDAWLTLRKETAMLLLEETVIAGEMTVLRRCKEWCLRNTATEAEAIVQLKDFLHLIDFTSMTEDELEEVEGGATVPLEFIYNVFKRAVLGLAPKGSPRNGGIILQWDISRTSSSAVRFDINRVVKEPTSFGEVMVTALNKFAIGQHYWTYTIHDLRSPHDCFVGVVKKEKGGAAETAYMFEPCCCQLRVPDGTRFKQFCQRDVQSPSSECYPLRDGKCVIGIHVNFNTSTITFYDHELKEPLYEITESPLPSPLYPVATVAHGTNGGVTLSDSTTYLEDRSIHVDRHRSPKKTPTKSGSARSLR